MKRTSKRRTKLAAGGLPADVIFIIIQAAAQGSRPDFKTLRALGGTARAFRRESQKHIYQDILVYTSKEHQDHGGYFSPRPYDNESRLDARELQELVEDCPWVTNLVRGVRIRWDYDADSVDIVEEVAPLITTFKNVERLTIGRHIMYEPQDWNEVSKDVTDAWTSLIVLPSVTFLRLSGIKNIPNTVLLSCERLRTLYLDFGSTTFASADSEDTDVQTPLKLPRLRTTAGEFSIRSIFGIGGFYKTFVDCSVLTNLHITYSIFDNRYDPEVLPVLPNLLDLSIDLCMFLHKS